MLLLNVILAALITSSVLVIVGWLIWRPKWMGFSGATLWDWMKILPVPIFIGFSTMYFNISQRELEQLRIEEAAIQAYIQNMTNLVLEPSKTSDHYALARAQTSAILHIVSQDRATRALRFLDDFDILQKLNVDLAGLDFSSADMKGLHLDRIDFEGSSLLNADMEDGHFSGADFEGVDMSGADLKGGDFSGATFENTLFKGADLSWSDLRSADLSLAQDLTQKQIDSACVDQFTQLPSGLTPASKASDPCFEVKDD